MSGKLDLKKEEFISTYGASVYLKLSIISDVLKEHNIDISRVDKKQLAKLLGYSNLVLS